METEKPMSAVVGEKLATAIANLVSEAIASRDWSPQEFVALGSWAYSAPAPAIAASMFSDGASFATIRMVLATISKSGSDMAMRTVALLENEVARGAVPGERDIN